MTARAGDSHPPGDAPSARLGPVAAIVSGGQTGVDRAALEFAAAHGIPHSGWCPRGGWAEDLTEPPGVRALFPALRETPLRNVAQRTRWNVRDSDATLVFVDGHRPVVSEGTEMTLRAARELGRPVAVVDLARPGAAAAAARFVASLHAGSILNVAGPRASECRDIRDDARDLLEEVMRAVARDVAAA